MQMAKLTGSWSWQLVTGKVPLHISMKGKGETHMIHDEKCLASINVLKHAE
jgi:hypothetical protein